MRNNLFIIGTAAALAAAVSGCGAQRKALPATDNGSEDAVVQATVMADAHIMGGSAAVLPKGVIYRTSSPSAPLVPVTIGSDGQLLSYPAPTDLGAQPPVLDGGWILDTRGGISQDTRFTRWTYAEYRAMKQAPAPAEILAAIVPTVTVTEIVVLPVTASSATPAVADSLIRAGLPGCTVVLGPNN